MHDPLTAAEYAAIAETMSFPANAFINGSFRPAASGKTFRTLNPATGKVLAEVAACDAVDVDLAVAKEGGVRRRPLASALAGGAEGRSAGVRNAPRAQPA
jgi:hypothetical protein